MTLSVEAKPKYRWATKCFSNAENNKKRSVTQPHNREYRIEECGARRGFTAESVDEGERET